MMRLGKERRAVTKFRRLSGETEDKIMEQAYIHSIECVEAKALAILCLSSSADSGVHS